MEVEIIQQPTPPPPRDVVITLSYTEAVRLKTLLGWTEEPTHPNLWSTLGDAGVESDYSLSDKLARKFSGRDTTTRIKDQ